MGRATDEEQHLTKGLLRLTMACNERCPFCNVPVEDYARPTPPESEVMGELEAFIRSGERTLTVSGGEPTLYRDRLLEVIRRARAGGVEFVELQTNATLIDADYAAALHAAGLTSAFVSLLSHQPALHDELAGLPGAFEPCLRGIEALHQANVAITLNPVITRQTQHLLVEFVEFVAERLPFVKVISLSSVQPHGRAARALSLLPDYAVLAEMVPRARARAAAAGMLVVNPYCGLPLCIGWSDAAERAVEAAEAWHHHESGVAPTAFGLSNQGNKRHGEPCRRCALRTRCGGAWHAYWEHRAGSGIAPPLARREPFLSGFCDAGQDVVRAPGGPSEADFASLRACQAPTVWLLTERLKSGDARRLVAAGCSDLALVLDATSLPPETLSELRALAERNTSVEPQYRLRVVVGLRRLGSFGRAYAALTRIAEAGVEEVRLLVRGDERHERFVAAARRELSIDVGLALTRTRLESSRSPSSSRL